MLVSLVMRNLYWTVIVRQRIIVRPLSGRMGQQSAAVRSWALNVISELPDGMVMPLDHVARVSMALWPAWGIDEDRSLIRAG